MNIAFILYLGSMLEGKSNGIRMQALIWKKALEERGIHITLIDCWGDYNWATFDVIHVFGTSGTIDLLPRLYEKNQKIVVSPIIDSNRSILSHRVASYVRIPYLRLSSPNALLRKYSCYVSAFLVRTEYEGNILRAYGIPASKIIKIPLSYRNKVNLNTNTEKERYCLHVSLFTQARKNVMRLIQAAIKYKFKLILAGNKGTESDFEPFRAIIENNDNIIYEGFVSESKLNELYQKAKVFCLPSICEGVGLVALEAARCGCEIVITEIGGPKEYYNGMAFLVNPYDIDSIGMSVMKAFDGGYQPKLQNYIESTYSLQHTINLLEKAYHEIKHLH